jgi:hypothetical protein
MTWAHIENRHDVELWFAGACALLLLGACAAPGPVEPPSDRFGLSAQPQVHVVHHPPRRVFWLEGSGFAIAEAFQSMSIQKNLDLQDPVIHVKDRVIATLQRDIGLRNLRAVPDVSSDGTIDIIKERYPTGAVIELRTYSWGMENYRVKYAASAYLTTLSDSKRLWSTTCEWVILDKDKPSPDNMVDERELKQTLYGNNGAVLKAKLREAAEMCADQIAARLMSPGEHRRR